MNPFSKVKDTVLIEMVKEIAKKKKKQPEKIIEEMVYEAYNNLKQNLANIKITNYPNLHLQYQGNHINRCRLFKKAKIIFARQVNQLLWDIQDLLFMNAVSFLLIQHNADRQAFAWF